MKYLGIALMAAVLGLGLGLFQPVSAEAHGVDGYVYSRTQGWHSKMDDYDQMRNMHQGYRMNQYRDGYSHRWNGDWFQGCRGNGDEPLN